MIWQVHGKCVTVWNPHGSEHYRLLGADYRLLTREGGCAQQNKSETNKEQQSRKALQFCEEGLQGGFRINKLSWPREESLTAAERFVCRNPQIKGLPGIPECCACWILLWEELGCVRRSFSSLLTSQSWMKLARCDLERQESFGTRHGCSQQPSGTWGEVAPSELGLCFQTAKGRNWELQGKELWRGACSAHQSWGRKEGALQCCLFKLGWDVGGQCGQHVQTASAVTAGTAGWTAPSRSQHSDSELQGSCTDHSGRSTRRCQCHLLPCWLGPASLQSVSTWLGKHHALVMFPSANPSSCCSPKMPACRFHRTGSSSGSPLARLCCQRRALIALTRTKFHCCWQQGGRGPALALLSSVRLTPLDSWSCCTQLMCSVKCSSHLPWKLSLPGGREMPGLCSVTISACLKPGVVTHPHLSRDHLRKSWQQTRSEAWWYHLERVFIAREELVLEHVCFLKNEVTWQCKWILPARLVSLGNKQQ